ncbi:MAG: hypothetical protein CM1200mP39_30780 [Dehalococcoidia bacterium]|nr:MAG: hypothetical protein CM1200mP39_30780 [Dehalococcoidia bacterium]
MEGLAKLTPFLQKKEKLGLSGRVAKALTVVQGLGAYSIARPCPIALDWHDQRSLSRLSLYLVFRQVAYEALNILDGFDLTNRADSYAYRTGR